VRAASTATEIADEAAPLLLLLFEDGVGLGEEEVFGRRETVDGPGDGVEEEGAGFPRNDPDGPSELGMLVFVRVGGGVLFMRLHSGFPAESRKHVYPGAKSLVRHIISVCGGGHTTAEVLSRTHDVTRGRTLRGTIIRASLTDRAAPALTINHGTSVPASDKIRKPSSFIVCETYPGSQQPPPLQQVSPAAQQEFPWQPLVPAIQHPVE
jgi:hypothetical protein